MTAGAMMRGSVSMTVVMRYVDVLLVSLKSVGQSRNLVPRVDVTAQINGTNRNGFLGFGILCRHV